MSLMLICKLSTPLNVFISNTKEEKEKTIQDVISRRKQHTRRVDSKLIMKAYNYAYSYYVFNVNL